MSKAEPCMLFFCLLFLEEGGRKEEGGGITASLTLSISNHSNKLVNEAP